MKKAIVLNRMYVGDYLTSNLGHEVINLYQADNGGYYLYLNATGDFVKAHQGKVGYMLFVKYFGVGEVEVIGYAEGLHDIYDADLKNGDKYQDNPKLRENQEDYIRKEDIRYGGVSLLDIFNNEEQQNVIITYKADAVYLPQKGVRLFIRFAVNKETDVQKRNNEPASLHEKSDVIVCLCGYQQAKASLKQYIYPEGTYPGDLTKESILEKQKDYTAVLEQLILKKEYWKKSSNIIDRKFLDQKLAMRPVSLFDICMIQNSENDFSNALSYFMLRPEYREMWCAFFAKYGIHLDENYLITREESAKIESNERKWKEQQSGGRIDLLIRDKSSFVIIENKIKSDINSIEEDGDGKQLERYWNYVQWLSEKKETERKNIYAFILMPQYGKPHIPESMKERYSVLTYKDVYDFLKDHKTVFSNDINFCFFFDAMQRHTFNNVNDYLYHEMQEKFFRRIKSINP